MPAIRRASLRIQTRSAVDPLRRRSHGLVARSVWKQRAAGRAHRGSSRPCRRAPRARSLARPAPHVEAALGLDGHRGRLAFAQREQADVAARSSRPDSLSVGDRTVIAEARACRACRCPSAATHVPRQIRQSRSNTSSAACGCTVRQHAQLRHHEDRVHRELGEALGLERVDHHQRRLRAARRVRQHAARADQQVELHVVDDASAPRVCLAERCRRSSAAAARPSASSRTPCAARTPAAAPRARSPARSPAPRASAGSSSGGSSCS